MAAHPFEITKEFDVEATPEETWEAVATGPGMDSWFLGRNEVEPREGGTARWTIGGFTIESTVTTWDPPRRFVNTGPEMPDGSLHKFDYTLEERAGGRTRVRYVHSGMLGGDWEAEYDAMSEGDPMYLDKLAEYLEFFRGRLGVPVEAMVPNGPGLGETMARFRRALGLADAVALGDPVQADLDHVGRIDGAVDYVGRSFIGVRTGDAMYRFIHGFEGSAMVGHHLFAPGVERTEAESAWGAWLAGLFGGDPSTT